MGEVLIAAIAASGGTAIVVGGLAAFLGKLWADRIERLAQQRFDLMKADLTRYSDSQFSHYNTLWASLCDLKKSAEDLWEIATAIKVEKFANQVKETKLQIEKSALLLEEDHYNKLIEAIEIFENFQFGKMRLIELRGDSQKIEGLAALAIRDLIENNGQHRSAYSNYLVELRNHLKSKIRGAQG